MKKGIAIFVLLMALFSVFSFAADDFTEAKAIIDAKTPCSQLTESQLEEVGDYYMEQMHPGAQHEAMEEMMGGEGSESLRAMHIAIAKRIYCGDTGGALLAGITEAAF